MKKISEIDGLKKSTGDKQEPVILPRFTQSAWMDLGPFDDADLAQTMFNSSQYPDNLTDFVGDRSQASDNSVFKIVTLDERFSKWIRSAYKKDRFSIDELMSISGDYAKNVSDECATECLVKSGMNVSRYMAAIPLVFTHFPNMLNTMETDFRIRKQQCQELEKAIAGTYGNIGVNAIVPGVILNASEISKLCIDEQAWVHDVVTISDSDDFTIMYSEQNYESPLEYFSVCFIPIVLEFFHSSAIINIKDIYSNIVDPLFNIAEQGPSDEITRIVLKSIDTKANLVAGHPILATNVEQYTKAVLSKFYSSLAMEMQNMKPGKISKPSLMS